MTDTAKLEISNEDHFQTPTITDAPFVSDDDTHKKPITLPTEITEYPSILSTISSFIKSVITPTPPALITIPPPKQSKTANLNAIKKIHKNGLIEQKDNSITEGNISVYFKNQHDILVEYIKQADAIVGCLAWLTSDKIIDALKQVKYGVNIIVDKETFISPNKTYYEKYKDLIPFCYDFEGINEVIKSEIKKSAVRCCGLIPPPPRGVKPSNWSYKGGYRGRYGFRNSRRKQNKPRMHNKFLVFGKMEGQNFKPYAVWTGSTNMSKNSENSLENGLYIKSEIVAGAYEKEWANILAISEGLDWKEYDCVPTLVLG